jgi:hypothetical protein
MRPRQAPSAASTASLFASTLSLLLVTACRGHASPDDCRTMTEHYIDLAVREAPGGAGLSPAQAQAVKEVELGLKRAEPSFRVVQDRCGEVTRAEVSCAVDSTSTKAWEACLPDAGR